MFSWCLVILWMIIIFTFSSQPAYVSSGTSSNVLEFLLNVLNISLDDEQTIFALHKLVRKSAHFVLYLILGILINNAFLQQLSDSKLTKMRIITYSFLFSLLYAISDETHQQFVIGRGSSHLDVFIDACGSLFGITLYYIIDFNNVKRNLRNVYAQKD